MQGFIKTIKLINNLLINLTDVDFIECSKILKISNLFVKNIDKCVK